MKRLFTILLAFILSFTTIVSTFAEPNVEEVNEKDATIENYENSKIENSDVAKDETNIESENNSQTDQDGIKEKDNVEDDDTSDDNLVIPENLGDSEEIKKDLTNISDNNSYLMYSEDVVNEEWEPDEYASFFQNSDDLFAKYVNQEFGVDYYNDNTVQYDADGNIVDPVSNSNTRLYLNSFEQLMYDKAIDHIKKIADGERSNTELILTYEELGLSEEPLIVIEDFYDCSKNQYVQAKVTAGENELKEKFPIDSVKVLKAIQSDNPSLLYWFGRTYYIGYSTSYGASGYADENNMLDGYYKISNFRIYLSVSPYYAELSGNGYIQSKADITKTGAVKSAVSNAKTIAKEYENLDDYEKLVAFKEKICTLVDYNHDAAYTGSVNTLEWGSNPWELIWVFDGDTSTNVVCEGYSKAFQYLCDLSSFNRNIMVSSVSGTMDGGAHMWNIVHWENKNYLVDVTNCDNYSSYMLNGHNALFMKGFASGNTKSGYSILHKRVDLGNGLYVPEHDIMYKYNADILNLYSGIENQLVLSESDFDPMEETEQEGTYKGEQALRWGTDKNNNSWGYFENEDGTYTLRVWKGKGTGILEDIRVINGITDGRAWFGRDYEKVTRIEIADDITVVGSSFFDGFIGCKSLYIGESVEVIKDRAFKALGNHSTVFSSFYFPSSVRVIEDYAFEHAGGFSKFCFTNDSRIEKLGTHCFDVLGLKRVSFYNEKKPEMFEIFNSAAVVEFEYPDNENWEGVEERKYGAWEIIWRKGFKDSNSYISMNSENGINCYNSFSQGSSYYTFACPKTGTYSIDLILDGFKPDNKNSFRCSMTLFSYSDLYPYPDRVSTPDLGKYARDTNTVKVEGFQLTGGITYKLIISISDVIIDNEYVDSSFSCDGHLEVIEYSREVTEGSFGNENDITWKYEEGKLLIGGTGALNVQINNAPYYIYQDEIEEIEIGKGITSICSNAFISMPKLRNVTFERGSNCERIGHFAFAFCGLLEEVALPQSVTIIETYAFLRDRNLNMLKIPCVYDREKTTDYLDYAMISEEDKGRLEKEEDYLFGYGIYSDLNNSITYIHSSESIETDDETHSFQCTRCNQDINEKHQFDSTGMVCLTCGYEKRPHVDSVSLDLFDGGSVGLNIYVDSIKPGTIVKVHFDNNKASREVLCSEDNLVILEDGSSCYRINCTVSAKEMNDAIYVSAYDNGLKLYFSNMSAVDGVLEYSVMQYLNKVLDENWTSEKGDTETKNMKQMAKAMRDYGLWSQKYFDYNPPAKWPSIPETDYSTITDPEIVGSLYLPDKVKYIGCSLVLEGSIKVRQYFEIDDDISNYTVSTNLDYGCKLVKKGNEENIYYIETNGLPASRLGDVITFSIVEKESNRKISIRYSPLNYCKKANNTGNALLANLTNSIYRYYEAANRYFGD